MAKPTTLRRALRGTAADVAGAYLHKNGPQTTRTVFAIAGFARKLSERRRSLQAAIRSGWLLENAAGDIDITDFARAHYDKLAGEKPVEPVGQIAAVRTVPDVFARPPLSKKYIPNPRGTRQDIPAWSVRTGTTFHTKA